MESGNITSIEKGEFWLPDEARVLPNHGILGDGGIRYRDKTYGMFDVLPNGRMVCKDGEGNISTAAQQNVESISPTGHVVTKRMIASRTRLRALSIAAMHQELEAAGLTIGDVGPNGGAIVKCAGMLTELRAC